MFLVSMSSLPGSVVTATYGEVKEQTNSHDKNVCYYQQQQQQSYRSIQPPPMNTKRRRRNDDNNNKYNNKGK